MPRLRTGYSFRAAAGQLDDCMSRLKECGWPVAPITDRASTFGWVRWGKLADKNGIRPVFGVELAVAKSVSEKKPVVDHWTFIAKDTIAPINKLVALATQQFRYQPLLSYAQANAAAKEVFAICGRRVSFEAVDADNVFYGLQPGAAKGHVRRALEAGMKVVMDRCPKIELFRPFWKPKLHLAI